MVERTLARTRLRAGAAALVAATVLTGCGRAETVAEYRRLVRMHLFLGAVGGLVLFAAAAAAFSWRHRRREWLALGPESPAAGVAALGSMSVLALLSGLAGTLVASAAVPDRPIVRDGMVVEFAAPGYALQGLVLALWALPLLAAIGVLFADMAEYPPRGVGAIPAALLHAGIVVVALRVGASDPSPAEAAFRVLTAAPAAVAVVAYAVLHAGWWRSRRRDC